MLTLHLKSEILDFASQHCHSFALTPLFPYSHFYSSSLPSPMTTYLCGQLCNCLFHVPVFKFRLRWIPLGLVSWHVLAPFFLFLYIPLTIFSNPFLQVPPEIPSTFHGFKLGLSTFISKSQLNKHRLTSLQVPNPLTHPTFLHFWDSKIIYSNINCLEATTSYFTSYLIHTSYSSFASLSPDLLGPAMMSLCNHQSLVNQYAYNQDH